MEAVSGGPTTPGAVKVHNEWNPIDYLLTHVDLFMPSYSAAKQQRERGKQMFTNRVYTCMSLLVVACFILPGSALAANNPHLTEGGVLVPAGSGWRLTPEPIFWPTSGGSELVRCSGGSLSGTVKANSGGVVEGEIPKGSVVVQGTGAVSADNSLPECTGSFGNAYVTVNSALCVRSDTTMAADEFQVTGGACGTGGKVVMTIGSTTAGACKYESTGALKGTFNTGGTEAKLSLIATSAGSGAKLIEGGFLCPTSLVIGWFWILETSNGVKITFS